MSILIKNVTLLPMSGEGTIVNNAYVRIKGQYISEVGSGEAPDGQDDLIIDGSGQLLMPGFINTHTHAAMTLLRGYADDLPLMEWLETKIWPLEDQMTGDDIYAGTRLAILEMIKSGTTCFADMYFSMDRVAEAVRDTGMRAVLARGMVGVGPEHQQALDESRELVANWHGAARGRIQFILGPHAPYTCPPDYLKRVIALAEELDTGIHIHLAETAGEVSDIEKQYGKTPMALMEDLGLFTRPTLAAHCVHVSAEDIKILKKYQVGVAHNPESNMKLASGIAPVADMLQAGIPVALGTDGASSNNNLDMLQEMRSAAFLQKVATMDTTVLPAYQALEMATCNGAAALGMDHELGQIKAGYKADLIMVSLQEAHMIPCHDVTANLVYAAQASDIQHVIIDGTPVMMNRKILLFDEEEVIEEARQTTRNLLKRAGKP